MKNLNAVLNDVMNDIMTESFWGPVEYKMPTTAKEAADLLRGQDESFLRSKGLDPEKLKQMVTMDNVNKAIVGAVSPNQDLSAELGQSAPIPEGPKTSAPASLLGRASAEAQYQAAMNNQNAGFLDKAGATLGYGLDRAKLAAQGLGDQIGTAWDNATPMERGLAIGIPTALAAGAGALYLRKKQREANKAAGR